MEYSKQFNPCFCGIYSQRILKQWQRKKKESLNPCFCGIYSQSIRHLLQYRVKFES